MHKRTRFLAVSGMIAALYTAVTAVSALFGLSSGAVQIRISEALCVLPVFTAAAIPGLTVGCLLSNLLLGGSVFDLALGTLATLLGAVLARLLRRLPFLAPLPTILANMALIPLVLILSGAGGWELYLTFALTVGAGELVSCGLFGTLLTRQLKKHPGFTEMLNRK